MKCNHGTENLALQLTAWAGAKPILLISSAQTQLMMYFAEAHPLVLSKWTALETAISSKSQTIEGGGMTSGVSRYLCQSLIEPIGNGLVGSDLRTWHRFWTDYGYSDITGLWKCCRLTRS